MNSLSIVENIYSTTVLFVLASTIHLIETVGAAFEELPEVKLRNIFFTLQKVHEQIILHSGGNEFNVPHMREEENYSLLTQEEANRIDDEYLNPLTTMCYTRDKQ